MDGHLLLVGGAAGGVGDGAVAAVRAVLDTVGPTEVRTCTAPGDAEAAIAALRGRTLVVAGGDGTLHVVVNALARAGRLAQVPVALVPLGTGNDLARGLGLPLDPVDAARAVLAGRPRPLDLIRSGRDVVVNAAHAGIGVAAAERATDLKGAVGPAAYAAGAVVAGVDADPLDLAVEVDGVPLGGGGPWLLVAVGNGSSVGGGTTLFPDADPADGRLEVVAVRDRGAWERLRLGLAARKGEHAELDGVRTARGREVVVRGVATWNDDGELGEPEAARTLRVAQAAWLLVR